MSPSSTCVAFACLLGAHALAAPLAVVNPSAEINGGVDREAIPSTAIPGWAGAGQVINDRTLGGNGNWRLSLEDSQELRQLTTNLVQAGAAYSLRFDAASFSGLPPSLTAELYVDNAGGPLVIAGRTFTLPTAEGVANWQGCQLLVSHGALDAHAGKALGIRFRGPASASSRFASVDQVRLDEWRAPPVGNPFLSDWSAEPDQSWLGGDFWANRLQDWEVAGGRAQTRLASPDRPYRTAHRLTTRMSEAPANLNLSVHAGLAGGTTASTFAGILLGAGQDLDYRAAALVHHSPGKRGGILAGMRASGMAILLDFRGTNVTALAQGLVPAGGRPEDSRIEVSATWVDPDYQLTVRVFDGNGITPVSTASATLEPQHLLGSFALCSHPGSSDARFWFNRFSGSGGKLEARPERAFGPVLSAQHSLHRRVLKLTAQLAPCNLARAAPVLLQTRTNETWQTRATAVPDPDAFTASFRVSGWDDTLDTPWRVQLALTNTAGVVSTHTYDGLIPRDPAATDEIVVAGLTCMIHTGPGFAGIDVDTTFPWIRDRLFFPHEQCTLQVARHQPHLAAFLGDQIYEGSSPTKADNSTSANRQLDYLYKWYLWCWTWRDLVRDRPCIVLPDDHDVFQGNLWGEGGRYVFDANDGGYVHPAAFVRMVERTQTSHLPDPLDPTPVLQGIGVYHAPWVYGRVGMAILEDRKFKNGPGDEGFGGVSPADPDADTGPFDKPGLHLLGTRQEAFLESFTSDWSGQDIKFALSQTPFASTTTHSGEGLTRRYYDLDSGGWPQTPRRRAVDLLRRSFSFHLTGDQHLSLVFQHGTTAPGDAILNFTVPSVANAFPRAWDPANSGAGPTSTVRPNLGDFFDGFGNPVRMLAVANPDSYYNRGSGQSPPNLHDRGPGYGIVRIRKSTRHFTFECWPLHADPTAPGAAMAAGWPVTRRQADNDGRTPAGYLPVVLTGDEREAVLRIQDEQSGQTVQALRIHGNRHRPAVHEAGRTYTVQILHGDETTPARTLTGLSPAAMGPHRITSFSALDPCIIRGHQTLLGWDCPGADSLTLSPGAGDVTPLTVNAVGFLGVSPLADTTYQLVSSATGGGTLNTSVTVRVHADWPEWLAGHFSPAERADPALESTLWGEAADPDGDGLANRLEFLLQSDPRTPSPSALPQVRLVDEAGQWFVHYSHPCLLEPSPERAVLEASPDLSAWTPVPGHELERIAQEPSPGSTDRITVRHTLPAVAPAESGTRRYYRLRIE